MGYLIKTIGNSPDAAVMAVVAASMNGAMDQQSQKTLTIQVGKLLRDLRATTPMRCLAELKQEQIWLDWAAVQEKKATAKQRLSIYCAIATGHFLRYLRRLTLPEQQRMQCYALPPPPIDLSERYFPSKQVRSAQRQERKATPDILVPLYPVLRQLVRLRKQLAERTLLAIREACRKVEAGEESLPYHFQPTDVIPEVNSDARTIAEVRVLGREVVMKLVLWDKRTWVIKHPDRYCDASVGHAQDSKEAYDDEHNCFFVQVESDARDFLWFGDLAQQRVFKKFKTWETEHSPVEPH